MGHCLGLYAGHTMLEELLFLCRIPHSSKTALIPRALPGLLLMLHQGSCKMVQLKGCKGRVHWAPLHRGRGL